MNIPPIFVLSLARAKARRAAMIKRLNDLGAQYEIVDGVDGETADPAIYESRLRQDIFRRKWGRDMTLGEIGCYLSHYNLWQRMVDEKIPHALILEDDTDWDGDMLSVLSDVLASRWRWDIVLLSGGNRRIPDRVLSEVGAASRQLVRCKRRMSTAAGYVLSLNGAAVLLHYCREIAAPVDTPYAEWWLNKLAFFCVNPPLVGQVESESLTTGGAFKKAPLIDRIVAVLWKQYDRRVCYFHCLMNPMPDKPDKDRT